MRIKQLLILFYAITAIATAKAAISVTSEQKIGMPLTSLLGSYKVTSCSGLGYEEEAYLLKVGSQIQINSEANSDQTNHYLRIEDGVVTLPSSANLNHGELTKRGSTQGDVAMDVSHWKEIVDNTSEQSAEELTVSSKITYKTCVGMSEKMCTSVYITQGIERATLSLQRNSKTVKYRYAKRNGDTRSADYTCELKRID